MNKGERLDISQGFSNFLSPSQLHRNKGENGSASDTQSFNSDFWSSPLRGR